MCQNAYDYVGKYFDERNLCSCFQTYGTMWKGVSFGALWISQTSFVLK
jgi:hypothetical protein